MIRKLIILGITCSTLVPWNLRAQLCNWVNTANMVTAIQAMDQVPGGVCPPGSQFTAAANYASFYYIPGSRNCRYMITLTFDCRIPRTCRLPAQGCFGNSARIDVLHLTQAGSQFEWQEDEYFWGLDQYPITAGPHFCDAITFTGTIDPADNLEVRGGDTLRLMYSVSGQVYDNNSGAWIKTVTISPLTSDAGTDITYDLVALPYDDLIVATLTVPDNFYAPKWRFKGNDQHPLGCEIVGSGDSCIIQGGGQAGSVEVECYEGLTFNGPLNGFPYGTSGTKFSKVLTVLPPPQITVNGQSDLEVSQGTTAQLQVTGQGAAVFNSVRWSITSASSLGCSIPNPTTGVLLVGNEAGDITIEAADYKNGQPTGYSISREITVLPASEIELDFKLAPGRLVQAFVSDYVPFGGQNPHWDLFQSFNAGTTIVTEGGVIQVGASIGQSASITLRARNANNTYTITKQIPIYPKPQLWLKPFDAGAIFTTCGLLVVGGHRAQFPADPSFVFLVEGAELGVSIEDFFTDARIEIEQELGMNATPNGTWIHPGGTPGPITVSVVDADDYSVQEDFLVRSPPRITSLSPQPMRAWGSQATAIAEGDFVGGVAWALASTPRNYYGYPSLPYPPGVPLPQVAPQGGNPFNGIITSGGLPCIIDIRACDPACNLDYCAEATVVIHAIPPAPPPGPQVLLDVSTVPVGGTVRPQAFVDYPQLMNGIIFKTRDPLLGDINPITGEIAPGNTVGPMRIYAQDTIYANYITPDTEDTVLNIVQNDIQFDRSLLIANGQPQATASIHPSAAAVFPTKTWCISSGGVCVNSPLASINANSGLITPSGSTPPSQLPAWITIRATATSGANSGPIAERHIQIRAIPTISFDQPYLIANGSSHAAAIISDLVVFPNATWSVSGNGEPGANGTLPSISQSGVITAGTRIGTYTVQAQSPPPINLVIQKTIELRANTPIQLERLFILADGNDTVQASLFNGNYPNVIWSLSTPPGQTFANGTTINYGGTPGLIRAGTTPGTVRIKADDGNTGGPIAETDLPVRAKLAVRFDVAKLQADGKAHCWATVTPAGQMVGATIWSIEGPDLGCRIDPAGRITAGRTKGRITVRAADEWTSGYNAEAALELVSKCDDDCETGDCIGGGGFANNNSVDVTISLGYADYGDKAINLRIKANEPLDPVTGASITSPSRLFLSQTTPDVVTQPAVITPNAPIQQVKTPAMLAIVPAEDVTPGQYKIKLYHNSQVANPAGPPPFSLIGGATPFAIWTISSPMANKFLITESRGGIDYVADYTFLNPGWEMVKDGARRKERRVRIGDTETYTVMDAANQDQIKYKEVSTYRSFNWGEELIRQTIGTGPNALITEWVYETSAASANYKRVIRVSLPNGSWETYSYGPDGRLARVISQFGDNPVPTTIAQQGQNRVKTIFYNDVLNREDIIVRLQGIEISHTYRFRSKSGDYDLLKEIRCQNRGVTSTSADGNLVKETYSYPKDHPHAFKPLRVLSGDGTIRVYSYSSAGNTLTTTIREGAPNGAKDDVVDGMQTIRVVDKAGNLVSEHVSNIGGGTPLTLSSKTGTAPDPFGRRTVFTFQDTSSESISYGSCCGIEAVTDREGVSTSYQYDNAKRVWVVEKAGVALVSTYDAAGRLETQTRRWQEGGTTQTKLLKSFEYDDAGRLIESTDLVGTTTYSISIVGGHEVITTTYPNGSTKVETFAKDGSLLEIAGSAVNPVKYVYGADSDGEFVKEIKIRGGSENEWTKRYVDMRGRPYKTVYPTGASTTASSLSYFSQTTGQVERQVDFSEVTSLFQYNSRGELMRRAVDLNDNLQIDDGERVKVQGVSYASYQGRNVRRTDVYTGELAIVPLIVNGSFEEAPISSECDTFGTIPGWTIVQGTTANFRSFDPCDLDFLGSSSGSTLLNPIDGQQIAVLNAAATSYSSVRQDLPVTIENNAPYILRFRVGTGLRWTTTKSVTVSLNTVEDNITLASIVVAAPAAGTFIPVELTYTATAANVGKHLAVWFSINGYVAPERIYLDKVEVFSQMTLPSIPSATGWSSLDGRFSWTTIAGQTSSHAEDYFTAQRKRVVTDTAPDTSKMIQEYIDGRLQSVTLQDGNGVPLEKTSYVYYPNGLLWKEVDARNGATVYTYDSAENIATITTPAPGFGETLGQTTTIVTDYLNPQGRIETVTQPDNSQIIREYYLTGELKKSRGGQSPQADYEYEQGRVTKIRTCRDASNPSVEQTTSFGYHPYRGFLESKTIAGTLSATYEYYGSGRLKKRIWNGGPTTTYTYNKAGELETVDHSDTAALNPDVRYAYNSRGEFSTVDDASGSHDYTYYANQRIDEEIHRLGVLDGINVKHQYDVYLRPQDLTLKRSGASLFTHSLAYHDQTSRLKSINSGNHFVSYEYEPNSSLIKYERFKRDGAAGTPIVTTTQTYDSLNRLHDVSNAGGPADSRTVLYNQLNKREKITTQDGSYWSYQYDAHGRVTSGKKHWPDQSTVAGQQFEYAFDDADNRVSAKAGGNGSGSNLRSAQFVPDSRNQYLGREVPGFVDVIGTANPLATVTANNTHGERRGDYFRVEMPIPNEVGAVRVDATVRGVRFDTTANRDVMTTEQRNFTLARRSETFQYDTRGNLAQDGVWTYGWDADNRLISMEQPQYLRILFAYDYQGRRVQKAVQTWATSQYQTVNIARYVYEGWTLIAELDGLNNNSLRQFYVWGPDQRGSLSYGGGHGALQLLWDAASGMHFVTLDASGNVAALVRAADNTVVATYDYGPFGEPLIATGPMKAACPFRYGSRYQDNETGLIYFGYRYYSPSLGRWLSRDPLGEAGGVNLYAFSGNDPVNLFDPLGLSWGQDVDDSIFFLGRYGHAVVRDGVTGPFKATYALTFGIDETIEDLVGVINAVPGLVKRFKSGQLKCLVGESIEEFERRPIREQIEILADALGGTVGESVSTVGIGKLLKLLKLGRLAPAATGGVASGGEWIFKAGTPDAVIDAAVKRAIETLDRYNPNYRFSPTPSEYDRVGWTRYDQVKSVTLYPDGDVLALIEEAHHVETAVRRGFWGDVIESDAQRRTRGALLEAEWEKYARSIGAVRKK